MTETAVPRLVFLDTETTGLSLSADIWEVAGIVRDPGSDDEPFHYFVKHSAAKAAGLPESFRADHDARFDPNEAVSREVVANALVNLLRGAHIVGAVPNFDTERIALMMRDYGLIPKWHYHLIDVETLAIGYLAALGIQVPLPWDSDALSRAVNIEPPITGRHTAMGDAEWARNLYDVLQPFTSSTPKDSEEGSNG